MLQQAYLGVLVACLCVDSPVCMQASVELHNFCSSTATSLTPWHQNKHSASLFDHVHQLWRQSDLPVQRATALSAAGLTTAKSSDLLLDPQHSLDGPVNDSSLPLSANNLPPHTFTSLIDPSEIQICLRPDGQAWVLGAGTYGTVSHKMHYLELWTSLGGAHTR